MVMIYDPNVPQWQPVAADFETCSSVAELQHDKTHLQFL
jgi:hypothetical protein